MNSVSSESNPDGSNRWVGKLELEFHQSNQRTVLGSTRRQGPLCVQRPFYPENSVCHLYLLHPPGGMVGGDSLSCNINLKPSTHTLITTPAAQKVYRSSGNPSRWSASLRVAENATLEWLPQDTILFGGSDWQSNTQVNLHPRAKFCGWETTSLGRPAAGDKYASGTFDQRLKLTIDDNPVLIDRFTGDADNACLTATTGLQDRRIFSTFLAYPAEQELLDCLRRTLSGHQLGLTIVDNLLIARLLAQDVQIIVRKLQYIWSIWREMTCELKACAPRIWYT